jgi:hypothetical protein
MSRSDLAYEMKKVLGHLPYLARGFDCNMTMIWDANAKDAWVQLHKDIKATKIEIRNGTAK